MSYQNIPLELQAVKAWIIWRFEDIGTRKPTKVPYSPNNGKHADVNDPSTWSDFNTAIRICSERNFDGIGFVFSNNDPYSFIDLDDTEFLQNGTPNPNYKIDLDRQIKIFKEFNSYAEISPSGKGLHIIVRGHVPAGRRRSFIEVYSNGRYATFTGNVYNDHNIINEKQELLTQLWEQMGGGINNYAYKGDDVEKETDAQIIDQAISAINGDKFKILLDGQWNEIYPSQSEADLSFINIVAFYTQNRNQIKRIFRASNLGQRIKASREDYVDWMINKSFDQMLPPIDFDGFKNAIELKLAIKNNEIKNSNDASQIELPLSVSSLNNTVSHKFTPVAQRLEPSAHNGQVASSSLARSTISIPPGLVGEIAQFIYQAAPRSVPEIALAASMGLLAGICGRAYNISGTGLNQYILLLADTGTGKEGAASGIDRLMETIKLQVPTSSNFIGPAEMASGQALIKHINKGSQCFVSILGEFGLRIQQMSSEHASSAEKKLKQVLLDLYNKSGYGRIFRGNIYSEREKNIPDTYAPAFSILGESVPETFYNALSEEMISEGLLPRFMIIEYNGPRPPLNKNAINVMPPFQLTEKLGSLVANCELIMHSKRVVHVACEDEAMKMLDQFDDYSTNLINSTNKDVVRQLWNRAHMKALKISALIAVGVNMIEPVVLPDYVVWAINMVQSDIRALSSKFEAGLIGANSNELKQIVEIKRVIREFLTEDWNKISRYYDRQDIHFAKIIPVQFLNRRLGSLSCFRMDRNGPTFALKRALKTLCDQDILREIGKRELSERFGTMQQAFVLSNLGMLG